MIQLIKTLLLSKKFLAMIAGLIVAFAARRGLSLSDTEVAGILAVVISYIFSQGISDSGKEAAKINAVASLSGENPASTKAMAKVAESVK